MNLPVGQRFRPKEAPKTLRHCPKNIKIQSRTLQTVRIEPKSPRRKPRFTPKKFRKDKILTKKNLSWSSSSLVSPLRGSAVPPSPGC